MNAIARFWINKSHNIINQEYESAINNYKRQKENFLKQLNIEVETAENEFINQVNQEVKNSIEVELDQVFKLVTDYVEEYVISLMQPGDTNYKALVDRYETIIKKQEEKIVNSKNLYTNLKKDIENFLINNKTTKETIMKYVSLKTSLNPKNEDIQNNLFGYARKLILQQLQGKKKLDYSTQHYKTALKGYCKENLLESAFRQVLEKYSDKTIKQTGSLTNEKAKQIKYDLFIGNSNIKNYSNSELTDYINKLEALQGSFEITTSVDLPFFGGGIQSKSWILPWSENSVGGNRKYLSFGSNKSLMPEGYDAHFWHAGVYNVMSNLTTAIGPLNFLFSTGDQVYWTASLLAELKEKSYVLAFNYSKKQNKIISPEISAQPHID